MAVKILVTEDDVFLRDGLCEMLKKEGYDVVTAGTIEDAKASFMKESFNLIILAVVLPDGNGFDMCGFIREKNADVSILFLTARLNMILTVLNQVAAALQEKFLLAKAKLQQQIFVLTAKKPVM